MKAVEITDQMNSATSPQAEAIDNIVGANLYDISPDVFKEHSGVLKEDIKKLEAPSVATPVVAEEISKSAEHAAAIGPDAQSLSWIENQYSRVANRVTGFFADIGREEVERGRALGKNYSRFVAAAAVAAAKKVGPEQDLNNMNWRKLWGPLSEDEELELISMREMSKHNFGYTDFGLDDAESLPADVVAQIADLPAMLYRNKGTIAAVTGASVLSAGGTGALVGSAAGGVGAAPGFLAGAGIGLLPGLSSGYLAASFMDAFRNTSASVYNDLDQAVNDDGLPLNIDELHKKQISLGVGIVSGGVSLVSDKFLMKSVPWLRNILTPKGVKELLTKPGNETLKTALAGIGKAMLSEGTEESLQEIVEIIGAEIGGTFDGGQIKFINGLANAANKLAESEKMTPEQKRVLRAGAVGSLAGGTFAATGELATTAINKIATVDPVQLTDRDAVRYRRHLLQSPDTKFIPILSDIVDFKGTPETQIAQVLEFQDVINASSEVSKATQLHKLSKERVSEIRGKVLSRSGITHVWLDKESLQEFANDDAKTKAVQDMFIPSEIQAMENNSPGKIPIQKFLDLVDDYPELTEYMKLHPEGPSPNSAQVWIKKKQETDAKKAQVREKLNLGEKSADERAHSLSFTVDTDSETFLSALGSQEVADAYLRRLDSDELIDGANKVEINAIRERVQAVRDQLPNEKTAKEIMTQALENPEPANDIFNEADYLASPTVSEAIKKVIPEAETETIHNGQIEARMEVVKVINDSAIAERESVIDIYEEIGTEAENQTELERIKDDPNIKLVEKFISKERGTTTTARFTLDVDLTATHHKKGYSPFAIDPTLLSDTQKAKYLKDPQLKKRKVFVKGGLHPDDAAILFGANRGDNMLRILATTPTIDEALRANLEKKQDQIRLDAEESVDFDHRATAKAYHNKTYNHLQELKFLLAQNWPALKKGIKRIALKLPRIDELTRNARHAIAQTKIGDLNVTRFKVAERKSERIAVEAVLKNDIERAFQSKESAALNSELTIAAKDAVVRVNRVIEFARKLNDAKYRNVLKEAGMEAAVDELLDVFNLDPSKKDRAIQGSYQKWVEKQIALGNGNFQINERLSDVRESLQDMTVEEVLVVGKRLRTIYHSAQIENRLQLEYGDAAIELQTREALVDRLHEQATKHIEYNPKRAITKSKDSLTALQSAAATLRSMTSSLKNMEHILVNVDGKVGGIFHESIVAPLNGIGKYKDQGRSGKINDMIALQKHFNKAVIDVIGRDEWRQLKNTFVQIPEFAKSTKLNGGRVSMSQLFVMLLNTGNDGNVDRLVTNMAEDGFATDIETIRKILDRELDEKFAVAAQNVMDAFASYFPRVTKLHEDMTGTRPEFVEAVPFIHKGKRYPGGYFPIIYESEMSYEKIIQKVNRGEKALKGETDFHLGDHYYADDMTRHNHTERRKGSKQMLSLSVDSLGMAFEMVIHDLNFRKPIADAIKLVTDETVSKDITSIVGVDDYNVIVNTIVEASQSIEMENNILYDSTKIGEKLAARGRAGLSAAYLLGNITSVAIQPTSLVYSVEQMGVHGVQHLSNTLRKILENPALFPRMMDVAEQINPAIRSFRENIDDSTRDAISRLMPKKHLHKNLTPLDLMREFVANKGYEVLGTVDQLQKVVVTLSAYRQFLDGDAPGYDLATVKAMTPAEQDHQAKVYATSVARLTLTTGSELDKSPFQKKYKGWAMFMNDPRNIFNNTLRQGRDIRHAVKRKEFRRAGRYALGAYATQFAASTMLDLIRGNPTPFGESGSDDPEDWAWEILAYMAKVPYEIFGGNIPVVREGKFAIDTKEWNRDNIVVNSPATKMISDVANVAFLGFNFMQFVNEERELSKKDLKSIGFVTSYAVGGIPVNSMFKFAGMLEASEPEESDSTFGKIFNLEFEELKKSEEEVSESEQLDEETMKALEDIHIQVNPPEEGAALEIPEGTIEAIKEAESGGKVFAKNPNSSAAGLYQFTEATWQDIMDRAPELNLTDNGRVSKDTDQQERAMEWFTKQNAQILQGENIPLTIENIYAAHFLGAKKAVEVLKTTADTKMKMLVSNETMVANDFKNNMRVRDFKQWLTRKVGEKVVEVTKLDKQNS